MYFQILKTASPKLKTQWTNLIANLTEMQKEFTNHKTDQKKSDRMSCKDKGLGGGRGKTKKKEKVNETEKAE